MRTNLVASLRESTVSSCTLPGVDALFYFVLLFIVVLLQNDVFVLAEVDEREHTGSSRPVQVGTGSAAPLGP